MPLSDTLHPTPDLLHAHSAGRLAPAEAAEVQRHLETCTVCAGTLCTPPPEPGMRTAWPTGGLSRPVPIIHPSEVPPELANHPRYQLLRRLGAGGMGTVYQAIHRLMEREVALKIINATLTRQPEAVGRFLLEVKAAARLHHPNIVTAHDAEQVGEVHVLVMELVDGISLSRLVEKKGPLSIEHACHFIRQAALGLQHAHERGLVHRDIKPHNLMVTRKGLLKILDFGLARLVQADTLPGGDSGRLTHLGQIMGTPDYMSPEQASNSRVVDCRADLYSLGCTLYHLLAGRPPFPDGTVLQRAASHISKTPRPLQELRPDLPADLLAVVARMMAKFPEDRYQSAGEVARDLGGIGRAAPEEQSKPEMTAVVPFLETEETASRQETPTAPLRPRRPSRARRQRPRGRRSRVALVVLCVGVMLALTAGAFFTAKALIARPAAQPGGAAEPAAGATNTTRPKVLLVVPRRDFWATDFDALTRALRTAPVDVKIASSVPLAALPDPPGKPLAVDVDLVRARASDYAAVIFLSGGPTNEFAAAPLARQMAKTFIEDACKQGKLVAALGNGGAVLAKAGALSGKKATGDPGVRPFLEEHGATVVVEDVVVDGNVFTARDEDAAGGLVTKLMEALRLPYTAPAASSASSEGKYKFKKKGKGKKGKGDY